MPNERTALDIPSFSNLDDFKPCKKNQKLDVPKTKKIVDKTSSFPSREPVAEWQLNLKGPSDILDRFKIMCKNDRRPYYDMLNILMDNFIEQLKFKPRITSALKCLVAFLHYACTKLARWTVLSVIICPTDTSNI